MVSNGSAEGPMFNCVRNAQAGGKVKGGKAVKSKGIALINRVNQLIRVPIFNV